MSRCLGVMQVLMFGRLMLSNRNNVDGAHNDDKALPVSEVVRGINRRPAPGEAVDGDWWGCGGARIRRSR